MNNTHVKGSEYENPSQGETPLVNEQSIICNSFYMDVESTVHSNVDSSDTCTETNSSITVPSQCSNETKNNTFVISEKQTFIINSCEQNETDSELYIEPSIGNEQHNVLNTPEKDANRNIENKNSVKNFEIDTSVIINKNILNEETHEDIAELSNDCTFALGSELSGNDGHFNNSKTLVAGSSQIRETSVSPSIGPSLNHFGLIPEEDSRSSILNSTRIPGFISQFSDNSIVISNSNAVPQSDTIVTSNFSLSQLRCYGSDESLNGDPLENSTYYREIDNDISDKESDSSSTSSSSILISDDSSDSDSIIGDPDCEKLTLPKPIKAKGELDLNDLPPIEDLKISVPEEDCTPIGHVFQIVDKLVVIQAFKDKPALNLDSVLFLQEGKPFGKVFDVFGPVTEPYYCVRFNSNNEIKEKNISINQMVYCAPKTKYTNYVFLAQLLECKGSDASWENDLEPPAMFLEYSDDEQEQKAKKKLRKNAKKNQKPEPDEPASKKHFSYERKMNKRNLEISAPKKKPENNQIRDYQQRPSSSFRDVSSSSYSSMSDIPYQIFGRPPVFTARLPSPVRHFPPRHNIFPPRPDMIPPRPDMFHTRPNMFPPRPDMIPPRPNMFPLRPPLQQSRPFNPLGTNSSKHHPLNSFETSMPNDCIDSNNSNYYSQAIQPRNSLASNAHSFLPLPFHENNPRLRNPYPHHSRSPHSNLPTGNLWLQRPHSTSLNPSQSFWESSRPNNSPQSSHHAYPPSHPF